MAKKTGTKILINLSGSSENTIKLKNTKIQATIKKDTNGEVFLFEFTAFLLVTFPKVALLEFW